MATDTEDYGLIFSQMSSRCKGTSVVSLLTYLDLSLFRLKQLFLLFQAHTWKSMRWHSLDMLSCTIISFKCIEKEIVDVKIKVLCVQNQNLCSPLSHQISNNLSPPVARGPSCQCL